jgi:LPS sulfotransferase NodH
LAYGAHPRFWVERERWAEFSQVSDATRAAWAWRRYVTAAGAVPERTIELRYEQLVADPAAAAAPVADALGVEPELVAERLARVHDRSAGRWRRDLTADQLADVEREAGETLVSLGYLLA